MGIPMEQRARKLASVQRVVAVEPIPGADAIERITVLGWHLVARKGEFLPGDPCVYVEIDSFLPEKPEFEFLRPRGFRIRTIRLRGQVSQGIAFPLSVLGPPSLLPASILTHEEGTDVTVLLGIEKYEPPIPASIAGEIKGVFPGFLFKTDEPRCQSIPGVLDRHAGVRGYATEKLNGTSVTYYLKDGEFGVCSRNYELREDERNTLWLVARKGNIEGKLRRIPGNSALQAEVIGPGIQGNPYRLKHHEYRAFNLFDIDRGHYEDYRSFVETAQMLEIPTVPILPGEILLPACADDLVALAEGKSVLNPDAEREGIVWRPFEETRDPEIGRLSIKAISNRFLLGGGE